MDCYYDKSDTSTRLPDLTHHDLANTEHPPQEENTFTLIFLLQIYTTKDAQQCMIAFCSYLLRKDVILNNCHVKENIDPTEMPHTNYLIRAHPIL